jgi:hypothetical protein
MFLNRVWNDPRGFPIFCESSCLTRSNLEGVDLSMSSHHRHGYRSPRKVANGGVIRRLQLQLIASSPFMDRILGNDLTQWTFEPHSFHVYGISYPMMKRPCTTYGRSRIRFQRLELRRTCYQNAVEVYVVPPKFQMFSVPCFNRFIKFTSDTNNDS